MLGNSVTVLYGDSTPSTLPPDILDVITSLVDCGAVVASAYHELTELEQRERETSRWTDELLADLDRFQRQVESALSSTVAPASRREIQELGAETMDASMRTIDDSRRRTLGNLERDRTLIETRRKELMEGMRAALESFAMPLRTRMPRRIVGRMFDGRKYRDEALFEVVDGVRPRLSIEPDTSEAPRRLRTLLGKGARIQIGTRRRRLRKTEEPAVFTLDDQVILESGVAPEKGHLVLAKKHGAASRIRLELSATSEGHVTAYGTRPDGVRAKLPASDTEIVAALWSLLCNEGARVIARPAQLLSVGIDGRDAKDRDDMLRVVERIVEHYRPLVADIASRSPSTEELALKVVQADGRREEIWTRRVDLGRRLAALTPALRRRVDIPALHAAADRITTDAPAPEATPEVVESPRAPKTSYAKSRPTGDTNVSRVRSQIARVALVQKELAEGASRKLKRVRLEAAPLGQEQQLEDAKTMRLQALRPTPASARAIARAEAKRSVEPPPLPDEEAAVPEVVAGAPVVEITEDISLSDLEEVDGNAEASTPAPEALEPEPEPEPVRATGVGTGLPPRRMPVPYRMRRPATGRHAPVGTARRAR